MTRRLRIAAVALAALLAPAGTAHAHALLEGTIPERGAVVERAPDRVVLRFSEPVEIAFGAVRVFDAKGEQVQAGEPFHPSGRGSEVAVRVARDLPDGGYTATYRVVSADSHPVSGGFVFSVGSEAAAPASSVADLLGDDKAGPVTSVAFGAARAVEYAAIALGLGVLAVLLLAWLPALRATAGADAPWRSAAAAFARRAQRLLVIAAAAGAAAALLALALQAATAEGASLWAALGDTPQVLDTRFGVVWGLGALAWVLAGVLAAARRAAVPALRPATVGAAGSALPGPGPWTAALAVPLLALALLPGLGGHAGVQDPVAVLLPANVLHVLAAGAWIGGLAVLVLALPAATRRAGARRAHPAAGRDARPLLGRGAGRRRGAADRRRRAVAARAGRRRRPLGHRLRTGDRDQGGARRRAARARRAQPPARRPAPAARGGAAATRPARRASSCAARCARRSRSASPRWRSPARSPATRRPPRSRPARSPAPPTSARRAPS